MKKEYTKPTMKVMELEFSDVICASPGEKCIRILDGSSSGHTHDKAYDSGFINWTPWNNESSN